MTKLSLPVLAASALLIACSSPAPEPTKVAEEAPKAKEDGPAAQLAKQATGIFGTLPEWMGEAKPSDEVIDLGRVLYYDPRLSVNNEISCNTCHNLETFGVDNEATSLGHHGGRGDRNSPTSLNAALHVAQFWDGRSPDVEDQAKGPILNPVEMGMPDEASVVKKLKGIEGYPELFSKAFPEAEDPVTYDNLATAIGAFERGLVTPDAFDRFQKGEHDALTAEQQQGLKTFMEVGCTACHTGPALGGNAYFKLGMVEPYETKDEGKFTVTKNEADKFVFKVPSLRNVTKTGPWLHDGSITELDEMIRLMGKHQVGRELTDEQVKSIATFLTALEGELDADYIKKPELPGS